MEKTRKMKKQAATILLVVPFFISQELFWEIISAISRIIGSNNDFELHRDAISVAASLLFVMFSIVLSKDVEIVKRFINKYSKIGKVMGIGAFYTHKVLLIIFYKFFDVILKSDSTEHIEARIEEFSKQSKSWRIVIGAMIWIVVVGEVLFFLSEKSPDMVKWSKIILDFIADCILLGLLVIGVYEVIEGETGTWK